MIKYLVIFLFILNLYVVSEENCSDNTICIITEQNDNGIDFYIKNIESFDLTFSIEFTEFINLSSGVKFPFTDSISGKQIKKVFSIKIIDKKKSWNYNYNYFWTYGTIYANHDDAYIYNLPYNKDQAYKVGQGFNGKFSHFGDNQYAIDWDMDEGTEVLAAREGTVVSIKDIFSTSGTEEKYKEMANYIMIKHKDGTIGEYDHFKFKGIVAKLGQEVKIGDLLGYSGNVGYSSGPHLHFIVYKAINGKSRQSFPIKFKTFKNGEAALIEGKFYSATQLK